MIQPMQMTKCLVIDRFFTKICEHARIDWLVNQEKQDELIGCVTVESFIKISLFQPLASYRFYQYLPDTCLDTFSQSGHPP